MEMLENCAESLTEATTLIRVEEDTHVQIVVRFRLQKLKSTALDRGHRVVAIVQNVLVVHQSWRGEAVFQKAEVQQS